MSFVGSGNQSIACIVKNYTLRRTQLSRRQKIHQIKLSEKKKKSNRIKQFLANMLRKIYDSKQTLKITFFLVFYFQPWNF